MTQQNGLTNLAQVLQDSATAKRIRSDTRLPEALREEYALAKMRREVDPAGHEEVKARVKAERQAWSQANRDEADALLRSGDYMTDQQRKDFRTIDIKSGLPSDSDVQELLDKTLARVMNMRDSLRAAWYYNQQNADDIFPSGELRSKRERQKLAPGATVMSKTMDDDEDNGTHGYFFSFIEHEESPFNVNTRFTKPATADGVLSTPADDDTKRRVVVDLEKLVKAGAIVLAGDILEDKIAMGFGIDRDKRITEQRVIGAGKAADRQEKSGVDAFDGLLTNVINTCALRLNAAMDNPAGDGMKILCELADLDFWTDQELWDFLSRRVLQSQLMTPMKVSTSMKGLKKTDADNREVE